MLEGYGDEHPSRARGIALALLPTAEGAEPDTEQAGEELSERIGGGSRRIAAMVEQIILYYLSVTMMGRTD